MTPDFTSLSCEGANPEVMLKINLHTASVPADRAAEAIKMQSTRKRKREDEGGTPAEAQQSEG